MCGIAGYFHFESERRADFAVIKKMTDIIAHRGPDGDGYFVMNNIAFGHRRLSIIDLTTGDQPMYNEDKSIVLIFNGEIYNYIELREELRSLGHKFITNSDAEVIINSYTQWGTDCQTHFNGMWAFALWDDKLKRLFISRDRIGEKPLYFSCYDNTLIFGSEIKAIVAYGVPRKPRVELTELFLSLSFVPAPYTFYENIYQLKAGNYLLVNCKRIVEKPYWDLPDISEKDLTKDVKTVEEKFIHLFYDSVKIRMRSDVDFGAFLSGGLDSSCVVGAMANHTNKPIQTFTIGSDNRQFDERVLAKLVSQKFKTVHHEGLITSELFDEALNHVIKQYDDPFGDSSAIPTEQISKYASHFVKMVLTGDGGDEVLSGYTTYQGEIFAEHYQNIPSSIRKIIPGLIEITSSFFSGNLRYKLNRIVNVLESSNLPFEQRLLSKLCSTSQVNLARIITPELETISFFDFYHDVMKNCKFTDPFYKLMYFQHKVTLPGDMLAKVDRMSMAHSIETRLPFLDYRIIELLFTVHKKLKMSGLTNKAILRNTIANQILPIELLRARKKGFSVPLREWFKEDNLIDKTVDLINNNSGELFYSQQGILKLINENSSARSDAGNFIWAFLVLRKWFDQFID
jgi:asparagine synthase (glutamine-hydrolysing)